MPVEPLAAILTDIEGTTTPIAFVRDTLFPFAAARLPDFLREREADPAVREQLDSVRALAPGAEPLASLLGWIAQDAKVTPLKALQGMIWRAGYRDGIVLGQIYPDVPPVLHGWRQSGLRLAVYSSGSIEAQRDLFAHSVAGDLAALFEAHFDTTIGAKREPDSYRRIADALDLPAGAILFLSDSGAELDAARMVGMRTCQLVREADGTTPAPGHASAADFPEVARRLASGSI